MDLDHFADTWNLRPPEARALFERTAVASVTLRRGRRVGFARADWDALRDALLGAVREAHEDSPERVGPGSADLAASAGKNRSREVVEAAIADLVRDGRLVREGRHLRLPGHEPRLSPRDAELWRKVSAHLGEDAVKPPVLSELAGTLGVDRDLLKLFLGRTAGRGVLVRVAPNRFFHPAALRRLAKAAERLAAASGTAGSTRRRSGTSPGSGATSPSRCWSSSMRPDSPGVSATPASSSGGRRTCSAEAPDHRPGRGSTEAGRDMNMEPNTIREPRPQPGVEVRGRGLAPSCRSAAQV